MLIIGKLGPKTSPNGASTNAQNQKLPNLFTPCLQHNKKERKDPRRFPVADPSKTARCSYAPLWLYANHRHAHPKVISNRTSATSASVACVTRRRLPRQTQCHASPHAQPPWILQGNGRERFLSKPTEFFRQITKMHGHASIIFQVIDMIPDSFPPTDRSREKEQRRKKTTYTFPDCTCSNIL